MASTIPCILQPYFSHSSSPPNPNRSVSLIPKLSCPFVGSARIGGRCPSTRRLGPGCGSRTTCWFRFGSNGVDAEGAGIYGSQRRDDFDRDDVEQYFYYTGMLAAEGTLDKLNALLSQNIHPVDMLLMMAASEGDKPKIEELMRAGADCTVKDADACTALDRASSKEIKDFILGFAAQKT